MIRAKDRRINNCRVFKVVITLRRDDMFDNCRVFKVVITLRRDDMSSRRSVTTTMRATLIDAPVLTIRDQVGETKLSLL